MGMDIDYIAAKLAIEELETLLGYTPHGKREAIADDIIEAVKKIKTKHKVKQHGKHRP